MFRKAILLMIITVNYCYAQQDWQPDDGKIYYTGGNVGIGVTTPVYKLEVVGSGALLKNPAATSYTTLRLYNDQSNLVRALTIDYSGSTRPGSLVTGGPTGESGSICTSGPYPLTLGTSNTMRLMIDPNGNVGIGIKNPDYKLTVDGNIKCEEVKVEVIPGTGPDYVFEPTYNLLPLSEVESYIKANKHLPEVPSAKEMEEEGLNLKEMNLLLLKKVEELTLHVIEMKKENVEQAKQIASQQNQIAILLNR